MRKILFPVCFLALLGCGGKATTPRARFELLVAAVRAKDLEAYKECWSVHARPDESMIERLEAGDDKLWEQMQGVFKGPQTLIERKRLSIDGRAHFKGKVDAPEADGLGVGSLMMVQDEDGWRMVSW